LIINGAAKQKFFAPEENRKGTIMSKRVFHFIIPILLVGAFSQPAFAPGGNGWMPSYTSSLGIAVANQPAPDEPFDTLAATIANPAALQKLGFKGAKKGMKIAIRNIGNVEWTTTVKGKEVHPCIIKVHVLDFMQVLEPEKGTLKLTVRK